MKRSIVIIAILLAPALPSAGQIVLEQVLVKINGEIITKTELEDRQVGYLRQKQQQVTQADLQNDEKLKQVLAEITPVILSDAIDEMLLVQRGNELGYRMTDEQFRQVLDNIKKENKIETEEQFQAAIKQEGLTIEQLRRQIERASLVNRVQQVEVMGKISVTDEEERAYYKVHAQEFTSPATVTLREILVTIPAAPNQPAGSVSVGLEEETKVKADSVRARASAGEDFGRLVSEFSEAPSKANGGLIGPILDNELAELIRDAIKGLKVGELSAVIRTPRGFQVLRLDAKTDSTVLPFEKARDQIADKVAMQKRGAEFEKYIRRLRAQAIIEWKNDALRKAYEQHVTKTAAS